MTARVMAMIDPWADANGQWISTGAVLAGVGPRGMGSGWVRVAASRSSITAAAHNDMIFAIVGEEFGFIGVTVVMGLVRRVSR